MEESVRNERKKAKIRSKNMPFIQWLGMILLIVLALLTIIPFLWMVSASFKANNEVFTIPIQWIPKTWHLENYLVIWSRIPLVTFFKNTAFLSVVITLIQLFTSSFAAYGFSKLNFKGRDILFLAYIGTIAVPLAVLYDPAVHYDEKSGFNRYVVVVGAITSVQCFWCVLVEAILQ